MQKIKYDKVRQLDKIVFLALGLILVALVIQMAILNWINNRNISKMSEVLLDCVVNVIEKNEQDEKDMIASLKEDYIVRAKAVAYIINANPEAEKDVDELKKIAKLMAVDEIHLLDALERSTVEPYRNITDTVLIPESRWNISNQCWKIKLLPCVRMSRRIPPREKRSCMPLPGMKPVPV